MNKQQLLTLSFLLSSGLARAQSEAVEIFPERLVASNRQEIQLTVTNESTFDIYCDYIHSPVIYRSQNTQNNIEDVITLKKVWIPKSFVLVTQAGKEKTNTLRSSGLYPDAYIDVVKNDFLSNYTKCAYKEMSKEEKQSYLRQVGSFAVLRKQWPLYSFTQISDGTQYPINHFFHLSEGSLLMQRRATGPVPPETLAATDYLLKENGDVSRRSGTQGTIDSQPYSDFKLGSAEHIRTLEEMLRATTTNGPFMVANNQDLKDVLYGLFEKTLVASQTAKKTSEGIAGALMLRSQYSGKCLNLQTTSLGVDGKAPGDLIIQWDCPPPNNPWSNNYWIPESQDDGSVKLRSEYSGLCLGPTTDKHVDGHPVVTQVACEQAATFFLDKPSQGGLMLRNKDEGLCVTLGHERGGYQNGEAFVYRPCEVEAQADQIFQSSRAHY